MRAIGVIALSLALVASAASAANRPVLRVSDLAPLTVHGVRFKPSEHLRVVVTTKRRYVRRLDATDNGAFTLKMRLVRVRRCGQYSVVVYGPAGGMRAAVKSPPQSCGPDRTP